MPTAPAPCWSRRSSTSARRPTSSRSAEPSSRGRSPSPRSRSWTRATTTLRSGVEDAETGAYLSEISTRYGIGVSWTAGEDLSVPARSLGTLREAERSDDEAEGASDPSVAPTATTPDSAAEGGAEQEDSP